MAGGRPPKERSFSNMLNIALTAKGLTGQTKLREVAEVLVSKALDGEGWAIKEVADRTDGKPMQQVELSGTIQSRIDNMTDEELEAIAAGSAGATETPSSPSKLN